jgi:tetratricopeptide (TPR) repeat protein
MQVNSFIEYLNNSVLISGQDEIQTIVNEFPYCQTSHLLYAYQLNKNNSILFDEQLKKAATYCTDRKRLFQQIHQGIEVEEETKEEVVEVVVENKKPLDELEKGYIGAAISSSILLESNEVNNLEVAQTNDKSEDVEVNLFDQESSHTFSDWLKHYSGEEVSLDSSKEKSLSNFDLIDKFIQEDPQIRPKKTEFYSPVNMARISVVDNSGLVSETLALIHVEQGNYQEAINTYEKLKLKNPEKSSYFASQIKILKQKIK